MSSGWNICPDCLVVFFREWRQCIMLAVQNEDIFSKSELDKIADGLSTWEASSETWNPLSLIYKPHRNAITGNYDANVLLAALKSRAKEVIWYDRRKGCGGLDLLGSQDGMLGIMINIQRNTLAGLWKGRHWVALRNIRGTWYNLDSDLPAPVPFIHGLQELENFLANMLEEVAEIFMVNNVIAECVGQAVS
eukprot:TRINITY_DN16200_c0_g1_i1.p1 TRINITY_DN16200_c0_g1~~TRINITY_DN16200_c0_g1_i1.p1  ORF type:complete len:192 (-),score=17.55 TRINITY_DN16200_c0_g1_i1:11-586(-)